MDALRSMARVALRYAAAAADGSRPQAGEAEQRLRRKQHAPSALVEGDVGRPSLGPLQKAGRRMLDAAMRGQTQTQSLRLQFSDENGGSLANRRFELSVGGQVIEGRTDGDGRLDARIPAGYEKGEITIHMDDGTGESLSWPVSIPKRR